jgi:8-oxo-dGTP diphosphatase
MQTDDTFSESAIRAKAEQDGITHISTGIAIVRDGKILMVRRAAGDFLGGVYELSGGGVDEGETIVDSAIREVKEETGLTVSRVVAAFEGFDYSTDKKPRVRQINYIVEVGSGEVILDPGEHDTFVWIDENNLDSVTMTEDMRQCVLGALSLI